MKKSTVFILLILISAAELGAYETYSTDAWQLIHLRELYARAGVAFPTGSFPVDIEELHEYALDLRSRLDSRKARAEVDSYLDQLQYEPAEAEIVSDLDFSYEQYFRGEDEWDTDYDYWRTYMDNPPAAAWSLSAGRDGGFGVHIAADFQAQHGREYPDNNLYRSQDENPLSVENYFITRGYFCGRYGDLLVQLGRTPVHFGAAGFSTTMPSDRLPYLDALYYTWRLGPLKMTSYVGTLYNEAGSGEISDMAGLPNIITPVDDGIIVYDDGVGNHTVAFGRTIIFNSLHRFEWAFPKVRLGLSAHNVITRENNALHIGDMFPVFSWHNAQVGVHNMSLIAEIEYAVMPGLVLFGQAGYDDINSADISGVGDTDIPTIDAYILGGEYKRLLFGGMFTVLLEGGTTHYLWGNFHEFDPERGNYLGRAIYRYLRDEQIVLLPLTSPYGPGARWVRGSLGYSWLNTGLSLILNGEVISHNTAADLVSTAYEESETVSEADRELWVEISTRLEYAAGFGETHRYSVYIEPAYVLRDTGGWFEITVGGQLELIHRGVIQE